VKETSGRCFFHILQRKMGGSRASPSFIFYGFNYFARQNVMHFAVLHGNLSFPIVLVGGGLPLLEAYS
jgi:hypothetical protein